MNWFKHSVAFTKKKHFQAKYSGNRSIQSWLSGDQMERNMTESFIETIENVRLNRNQLRETLINIRRQSDPITRKAKETALYELHEWLITDDLEPEPQDKDYQVFSQFLAEWNAYQIIDDKKSRKEQLK